MYSLAGTLKLGHGWGQSLIIHVDACTAKLKTALSAGLQDAELTERQASTFC